jgi:hypothetical protein
VVDHSIDYMKVEMASEMARRSRVEEAVVDVGDYSSARTMTSRPYVRVHLGLM